MKEKIELLVLSISVDLTFENKFTMFIQNLNYDVSGRLLKNQLKNTEPIH